MGFPRIALASIAAMLLKPVGDARPHFTDIAPRSSFSYVTNNGFTGGRKYFPQPMCGGVAVLDYNNDGLLDIFFTNGARFPTLDRPDASF